MSINAPTIEIDDIVMISIETEMGDLRLTGEVLGWTDAWHIEVRVIPKSDDDPYWYDEHGPEDEIIVLATDAKVVGVKEKRRDSECEGRATGAGQLESHRINGRMVKFTPRTGTKK